MRLIGSVIAVLIASVAIAEAPSQEINVLQDRSDRIIAELPNRMIVIAQRVPTTLVVSTQVWIKTGSIYEQEHVGAGLSHFLEHLLSGGTTSTTTEAESNALLGSMGAQTNAATSLDSVRYYINTTAEHAPTAIARLSDWMRNSRIIDAEYQRERDVIQREFEMGQGDPGRIFWKLTQQARFGDHHPAKHPTIGYIDEFLGVGRDEIHDFYRRMYVPNNMVFVVVGEIDPRKVVKQVSELWVDAPTGELPKVALPEESGEVESTTVEGFADIERPRLRMIWPGVRLAAPGDYALDLLASVLGQGESSRLVRSVRDEQRLVNNIDAYNASFHWGKGFFGVECEIADFPVHLRTEDDAAQVRIGEVRRAILGQVQRLRDEPVTEAELARAKRKILSDVVQANQTAQGVASRLAMDVIGTGDPDYLPRYAEAIQALTADDLRAAAKRFLTDPRLVTVELLPQPEGHELSFPARPEAVAEAEGIKMAPINLDNARLVEQLKTNLAAGGDAQAIAVDEPVKYTLDNGLRLIVQRSTVVPAVAMQMYWLGGLLGEQPGREGAANAMAAMMMRGTTTRTAAELAEAIEDLGATLGTSSGNNTTFSRATALTEDWPTVMELMAEVVLQPSFPESEWAKMRPRLAAQIDAQSASWSGELNERFREVYFPDFPWQTSPLGRKQVIESLTAEDLRAYHAAHLGAANTVIAVVGDVEPSEVKAKVEALFGKMPAKPQAAFDPGVPQSPSSETVAFATQKPLAAVKIGLGPGLARDNPDYPAMRVLSRVISDFPSGWLERALRGEGPGLVYAAHGHTVTGVVPGYYAVVFNTQPAQVDLATARSMAVIERARSEPVNDADLDRAKAKVLTNEFFGRQSNSSRAMQLALDWLYGIDDPDGKRFMQEVQRTDAVALLAVALKYLNNPVTVVITHESEEATDASERSKP